MPEQTGTSARLYVLIARQARVAAVLRRGPSKQVLLSKWHLKTDQFEDGQWFKGRIYERRCDLAPAGDHFIYFAANHKPPYGSWTALSTLPWLTAHTLWAEGDTWGGGGLFALTKCVAISSCSGNEKPTKGALPRPWTKIIPLSDYGKFDNPHSSEDIRMMRDGWERQQKSKWHLNSKWWHDKKERYAFDVEQPEVWVKSGSGGTALRFAEIAIGDRGGRWHVCTGQLTFARGEELDLGEIDWLDFDHNGDVLYAFNGALYRRGKNGHSDAVLVRDFNDLEFCERVAPYDDRVPDKNGNRRAWHPLDGQC